MFFTAGGSHGQARRGYVTVYGRIFPWKWTWEMASIMRDVVDEKCKKCAIYQVQSACWNYPGGLTNDSALYCSVVVSLHKSQIVCQDRDGGSWRHCIVRWGTAAHYWLLEMSSKFRERFQNVQRRPNFRWTHSVQMPVYHCVSQVWGIKNWYRLWDVGLVLVPVFSFQFAALYVVGSIILCSAIVLWKLSQSFIDTSAAAY